MSKTFAANKKANYGRVSSKNLFANNKDLGVAATKERNYWEVNRDTHPVNRWWFQRWEKKVKSESMWIDRVNSMPVDSKYKLRKVMDMPSRAPLILPIIMLIYLGYCYIRYSVFGTTPAEASVSTNRFVAALPRFPGTEAP